MKAKQIWIDGTEKECACPVGRQENILNGDDKTIAKRCRDCGRIVSWVGTCSQCGRERMMTKQVAKRGGLRLDFCKGSCQSQYEAAEKKRVAAAKSAAIVPRGEEGWSNK